MSRKRGTTRRSVASTSGSQPKQGGNSNHPEPRQPAPEKPVTSSRLRATVTETQTKSYEGPLPPSDELEAYERIHPGAADRIISMAEGYGAHRQRLESQSMNNAYSAHRNGQVIGGSVVALISGVCGYALHLGHVGFATKLGTWTIVTLAAIFVLDRLPQWRHFWRRPPSEGN